MNNEDGTLEKIKDEQVIKINWKDTKFVVLAVLLIALLLITVSSSIINLMRIENMAKLVQVEVERLRLMQEQLEENPELDILMAEILSYYESMSINPDVNKDRLMALTLEGFVAGFGDKYAAYLSPQYEENDKLMLSGHKIGVGINVIQDDRGLFITDVYPNSPAEAAGIKVGDIINSVDGQDYNGKNFFELAELIKGKDNTLVNVTIGTEIKSLKRQELYMPLVMYEEINEGIGYIKIERFENNAVQEFENAISFMEEKNIDKVIFDLRHNSGGTLNSATAIIDRMVGSGIIAKSENEGKISEIRANKSEFNGTFIVLTDEQTASASELFTLNMKKKKGATLIGKKTYGKGVIISKVGLSNGGSVFISTGMIYDGDGETVEGIGIIPDIEIDIHEDKSKNFYKILRAEDLQLCKAIEILS